VPLVHQRLLNAEPATSEMSGNTDKAAGMANEAAGKIKQGIGKAVGSDKNRVKALDSKPRAMPSSLRGTQRTRSRTALTT
jgi:hypothetical protein